MANNASIMKVVGAAELGNANYEIHPRTAAKVPKSTGKMPEILHIFANSKHHCTMVFNYNVVS
jgi:hypothetical protein